MAYHYGLRNTYRPTKLAKNAYGWSSAPEYNRADVPTALMDRPAGITSEQFAQNFAYEWFQSGDTIQGFSNPPFVSGAAGRLHPLLSYDDPDKDKGKLKGGPSRILRGYIRRASFEAADPMSKARLYFMFNPETIHREYVSYLEQGALDPFNTVYQSGNLVAPPAILDFSFELFFDRQEEAMDSNHPGTFVDYQFFDMVVRNVVPTDPNQVSNTLPDNGVMMINPRDITVVFSPQMTVQGRPLNARVTFEKFTHRMTPTRMRIALTMRAVYMGPIRDMTEYKAEEFAAEISIPIDEIKPPEYIITIGDVEGAIDQINGASFGGASDAVTSDYVAQFGIANDSNDRARQAALSWAIANVQEGTTLYNDNGSSRYNLPHSADCSGLVAEAYIRTGMGPAMGWNSHPGTAEMNRLFESGGWKTAQKFSIADAMSDRSLMRPGDLLYRIRQGKGHVKFFVAWDGDKVKCFHASGRGASPQVGYGSSSISSHDDYTYVARPVPLGADMSYNATNAPSSTTTVGTTPP